MVLSFKIAAAARTGDTAAIQEWFETKRQEWFETRDPDEKDENGRQLLHLAAYYGHCDTMRVLLDHGANPNITNRWEYPLSGTPLSGAAYRAKHDAAVLLLDRGAQIDLCGPDGWTPLIYAAKRGCCEMIRLLLRRGADLAVRSKYGSDAEALARRYLKDEAAALLADVRLAGGWDSYVRYPRKRLLALRVLCERGRASTDDALLRRLFPWHAPAADDDADVEQRPSLLARAPQGPRELPKEVFWLVFEFWRSARDSRY